MRGLLLMILTGGLTLAMAGCRRADLVEAEHSVRNAMRQPADIFANSEHERSTPDLRFITSFNGSCSISERKSSRCCSRARSGRRIPPDRESNVVVADNHVVHAPTFKPSQKFGKRRKVRQGAEAASVVDDHKASIVRACQ